MRKYTTQDRLKEVMKNRNLRQVDILNLTKPYQKILDTKLSKSHLSNYISGRSVPDNRKLTLLSTALNVSEPWLMGYEVEQKRKDNTSLTDKITDTVKKLNMKRQKKVLDFTKEQLEEQETEEVDDEIYYNYIPVYGYASAGTGNYVEDTPIETVRVKGYVPKHDIALWVSGDSMEPMFRDKDIIYINKTKDLFNGQIGVFILDGESYVKKIRIEDNGIKLVSLNKKYKDIIIKDYSDLHIIGRVII